MTLVLSVLRSLLLLLVEVDGPLSCPAAVGLPATRSQGISVSSAPPMKSLSAGSGLGDDDVPLRSRPFVVAAGVSVGRGKMEEGLATDTMRSRARR